MKSARIVIITTGDSDGIGPEVSINALADLGPTRGVVFCLFISEGDSFSKRLLRRLEPLFSLVQTSTLDDALSVPNLTSGQLLVVTSRQRPAYWVQQAAHACLRGQAKAIATAPLSKPEILSSGFKSIGHTEILKEACRTKTAFMAFLGNKFNVVLATGHLPIDAVADQLSAPLVEAAFNEVLCFQKALSTKTSAPIAILGLNPHAGDQGIIGTFEKKRLAPLIQKLKRAGHRVQGPLVPDVAFRPENWRRFSFYVSCYHDQGLIPFKMAHGYGAGVHVTLGLPIWRTSVDHGTAKDLYGKNRAVFAPMKRAIQMAIKLARSPYV